MDDFENNLANLRSQEKLQKQIEELEAAVKQYLDRDALVRYGNIKTANPQLAVSVLAVLGNAISQNQLRAALTDLQFKTILEKLTPQKKDFKITRK